MKYYLHDTNSRNDEKVTLLFIEYSYEGIGLFYSILEILASQEKPVNELVLKTQLKIGKKLDKQLKFMYKIGLLSIKNNDVFNENILNFSEKYQIKKEKTRKRVSEWREKQSDSENVTCYVPVSNAPKVKLSKVKEINKENETLCFDILKYFGYSEMNHPNKLFDISKFIKELIKYKELDLFKKQWANYKRLKDTTKQTKHTLNSFFENWNKEDWGIVLKNNSQNNKISIAGVTLPKR